MNIDELREYTEDRPLAEYMQAPRPEPLGIRGEERLTLMESLQDPEIARTMSQQAPRVAWPPSLEELVRPDDSDFWMGGSAVAGSRARPPVLPPTDLLDGHGEDIRSRHQRYRREQEPTEVVSPTGVRVTMSCDEDVTFPEDPTTAEVLADRQRRIRNARLDEDDIHGWDQRFRTAYSRLRTGIRTEAQSSGSATPSSTSKPISTESGVVRTRFHIRSQNNMVALKFDPPV